MSGLAGLVVADRTAVPAVVLIAVAGVMFKAPTRPGPTLRDVFSPKNVALIDPQKNLSHSSLIDSAAPPRDRRPVADRAAEDDEIGVLALLLLLLLQLPW